MKKIFVFLTVLFFMSSCSGYAVYKSATPGQKHVNLSKTQPTVAVLAITSSKADRFLVKEIESFLNETGNYKVIPQKKIQTIIGSYPADIKNFTSQGSAHEKEPYLSEEVRSWVNSARSKIRADYILVAWTESMSVITRSDSIGKTLQVPLFTRFISYPDSKIRGYSYFWTNKWFFMNVEKAIPKGITKASKIFVKKFNKINVVSG